MIRLTDLTLRRGSKLLLDGVNLTINTGQKMGLVGANGSGKSSFFALLRGELQQDGGELQMPAGWRLAHARQDTPASELSALDYVLSGHQDYWQLRQAIGEAEVVNDGSALAHLNSQFAEIDGWRLPSEAARLLRGLSFSDAQMQASVKTLSGGWRMRLNLAQALLQPSDLLLLDEPTNHLDLEAVLWLQQFLKRYQGTLILISHDRDFLDASVEDILHIENARLQQYRGNYSAFEKARSARQAQQMALHKKQQQQIAHLQAFIDRFKAKASKATQAQSRVKALQKMDLVTAADIRSQFSFTFRPLQKPANELIRLEEVAVGYNDQVVLSDIRLSIHGGDRIGLLGRNGQGKSTLIKLLGGELSPLQGERLSSQHLRVGYFAQHQMEQLNFEQSAIWHMQQVDARASEQQLRDFLGGFAFTGERVFEPVGQFSGGEKARLVLAMKVYEAPNLLLLDEPTNHFDIEMREALALALQDFEGAVILVAHDAHLLQAVADEFWLINKGKVEPFKGDLNAYQQWLRQYQWREDEHASNHKDKPTAQDRRREKKRREAELRQKKAPIRRQLEAVEQNINQLQDELTQIEQRLADTSLYEAQNKAELNDLLVRQRQLHNALQENEARWFELEQALEAIEQSFTNDA